MKVVNLFKALSDETRLRLVHLSLHHELNVNELVTILDMGQSGVSRHLKILTENMLLQSRRDGLWTFYSRVQEGEGVAFINSIRYLFNKESIFAKDLEKARRVLDEREKETVRFFDSIAEDWEKLKREIIGETDITQMILSITPHSEVSVDLGCGTGDLLESLRQKSERVIGVEKSTRMLESARKRFAGNQNDIDIRIGELEHLPLREGEVDMAVINMVLHHLPEPLKAIREVHRVLKKGKPFIIVDLETHKEETLRERFGDRWLGFSQQDIKAWLETNGFRIDSFRFFDLKKGLKGFLAYAEKK